MREDITNIELEILRGTQDLNSFEVGDEMYNSRIKAISGLLDIRKKMFDEIFDRSEKMEKMEQSKKEDMHKYIGYAINVAGIVLPLIFYGTWFRKGLTFEETGVYTSGMVKNLMNKMQPKLN